MLPLGWEETATAGGLGETLGRRGRRVPLVDLLIAAAAIHGGFDVRHAGDAHYVAIAGVSGCRVRNVRVTPRA